MATTRQLGNLTIHFLGENAAQLESMFADAYSRSETFRRDMHETSRTYKNIYIGRQLTDLQDQPSFGEAEFHRQDKNLTSGPAFGKAAGAENYFIAVPGGSHSLVHTGQTYPGSLLLALVHELLHPSQITRELAESGQLGRDQDTEARTQMREQKVAVELGMMPGKDFPDVIGSGAGYRVLPNVDAQPNFLPSSESEPVAPIGYRGPAQVKPTSPNWQEMGRPFAYPRYGAAGAPAAGAPNNLAPPVSPAAGEDPNDADPLPVRYLSSRITGVSLPSGLPAGATAPALVPLDANVDPRQARIADRPGGVNTSAPEAASRSSSQPEALLGLVSGKPMSFYPVQPPLFGFLEQAASDDEDWLIQLLAPRGRR